jgi:mRNA interferase MazF
MRRGEIRIIDLDPTVGQEANKRRPAIIVSNDGANNAASRLGRGILTVVPLTSHTERVYPFQVRLPSVSTGLSTDSKAQAEQVRAVSVSRIGEAVGFVDAELMQQVEDALRLHLGL